jgi:hypothetical protein
MKMDATSLTRPGPDTADLPKPNDAAGLTLEHNTERDGRDQRTDRRVGPSAPRWMAASLPH